MSKGEYHKLFKCVLMHVRVCTDRERIYVEEEREAASIQDGGSSSLTDCAAMLSQFIAVIPYIF